MLYPAELRVHLVVLISAKSGTFANIHGQARQALKPRDAAKRDRWIGANEVLRLCRSSCALLRDARLSNALAKSHPSPMSALVRYISHDRAGTPKGV